MRVKDMVLHGVWMKCILSCDFATYKLKYSLSPPKDGHCCNNGSNANLLKIKSIYFQERRNGISPPCVICKLHNCMLPMVAGYIKSTVTTVNVTDINGYYSNVGITVWWQALCSNLKYQTGKQHEKPICSISFDIENNCSHRKWHNALMWIFFDILINCWESIFSLVNVIYAMKIHQELDVLVCYEMTFSLREKTVRSLSMSL